METKHTIGPWRVTNGMPYILSESNREICKVNCDVKQEQDLDTITANAKLIAAAPELLEVAKYAFALLHQDLNDQFAPLVNDLRKAIKKATE